MRNKSENKKAISYIVHAVMYVREETSIIVTATDEAEADDIAREKIFNDECTWEPDCDYYAKPETISVEEYGE